MTHAFNADKIGEVVETPVGSSHNRRNIFRGDIRRLRQRWLLGEATATERDRICPLSRPPVLHMHTHTR